MRGDLTDKEWEIIGSLLPAERGQGCRPLRRAHLKLSEIPDYCPSLRLTDQGVMLGKGTIIVSLEDHSDGGTGLAVAGREADILALLSLARNELVDEAKVLGGLGVASRALMKGDTALAAIALCLIGQPRLEDDRLAKRLSLAARQLRSGTHPGDLLKLHGLSTVEDTLPPDGLWKFNSRHYPSGMGRLSGEFAPKDGSLLVLASDRKVNGQTVSVSHQPGGNYVVSNYQSVSGVVSSVGGYRGQCVSLVKELAGLPATKDWRAGERITGEGVPPLQPETIIATMDENGRYPGPDVDDKHAAVFMEYGEENGKKGIYVYDQYVRKDKSVKLPGRRFIAFGDKRNVQSNAYSYSVVKTAQ